MADKVEKAIWDRLDSLKGVLGVVPCVDGKYFYYEDEFPDTSFVGDPVQMTEHLMGMYRTEAQIHDYFTTIASGYDKIYISVQGTIFARMLNMDDGSKYAL